MYEKLYGKSGINENSGSASSIEQSLFYKMIYVGKVSSRFEFFGEIFVYRLVPEKIVVVPGRVSNILSNTYLFKKIYRIKQLKNFKKLLFKHCY